MQHTVAQVNIQKSGNAQVKVECATITLRPLHHNAYSLPLMHDHVLLLLLDSRWNGHWWAAQNTFHVVLIGKAFSFHCTSQLAHGMNDQDCMSKLSLPIWQAEHSPLDHRPGLVLEILSQLVLHCVRCKECYGLYKFGLRLRHWGIRPFWKEAWPPMCNVSLLIAGGWWARCAWWIRGYLASPRNWDWQERYSEWNGASWESIAWCGFLLVMLPS